MGGMVVLRASVALLQNKADVVFDPDNIMPKNLPSFQHHVPALTLPLSFRKKKYHDGSRSIDPPNLSSRSAAQLPHLYLQHKNLNGDRTGGVFISVRLEKFWFVLAAGKNLFRIKLSELVLAN